MEARKDSTRAGVPAMRERMRCTILLIAVLVACGCKKHQHGVERPAPVAAGAQSGEPVAAGEPEPVNPREDLDARDKDREASPEAEPVGAGLACDAYAKCCHAYIEALALATSIPPESVEATKEGCQAIEEIGALEEAAGACNLAMDAMRQAIDASAGSLPGFVPPPECQ